MKKKVVIEVEIDNEFDSGIYSAVADLLAYLEDYGVFSNMNTRIEELPKINLGLVPQEKWSL